MRKTCRVTIDDQVFSASRGDILLDAARNYGVDIPYDCRSGRCGICRVRVLNGLALGGECRESDVVRACQTRIMSDLDLKIASVPEIRAVSGHVHAVKRRAPDVVEVRIEPSEPLIYLPGQFLRVQFRGFPARCYNPTEPMDESAEPELLHLQVRQVEGGHVSTAIGHGIREGHQVRIMGPFGSAFLRPASESRLVLVASSTGFAAVWSIALAAIRENQHRRIVMVVGASTLQSLYMVDALCVLARLPNVTIIPVVEKRQPAPDVIRIGNVTDCIPALSADDAVHVCGPLPFVEAVRDIAAAADAPCYCVPFVSQGAERVEKGRLENALSRALGRRGGAKDAMTGADGGDSRPVPRSPRPGTARFIPSAIRPW